MNTFNEAPTDIDQTNKLIEQARRKGVRSGILITILALVLTAQVLIGANLVSDYFERGFNNEVMQDDRTYELVKNKSASKQFICTAVNKVYDLSTDTCVSVAASQPKDPYPVTTTIPPTTTMSPNGIPGD